MSEVRDKHPNPDEMRFCVDCGWRGTYGEMKHALWLESNSPIHAGIRIQAGGDGMNYRCPRCNNNILKVRYQKGAIIHP